MKIGILGAMNEEVRSLVGMLDNKKETKVARWTVYEGVLSGKEVAILECGIAKVNAAMCTQVLISQFGVDMVINTGVAGALSHRLSVNDIVVSIDAVQYDVDATATGDPIGQVPRMDVRFFEADKRLREVAVGAFEGEDIDFNVIEGRIATGDRFVSDGEFKKWLVETFDGACCEMEGASIAQVAHVNKIPFVVIRSISDQADGDANITYNEFVDIAAVRSADMVVRMLKKL